MANLVDSKGVPQYGWIQEPITDINFSDYPLSNTMDALVAPWRKKLKFNQFHFIGLLGEEFMAGIAIVDLKLVSNCFFYVWHKDRGLMVEESAIVPFGLGTNMDTSPDEGRSKFSHLGTKSEIFQKDKTTHVSLNSKSVNANIQLKQSNDYQPLRVCSQAGYNGWVYTQKSAGLTVSGEFKIKDERFDLSAMNLLGSVDWSCGFMRRETAWNWACFSGKDNQDRIVGLNLASGVNVTGVTENGFWLDGALHKLGPVRFNFLRHSPETPWMIESDCGRVNLTFMPEGKRTEKVNVGILASNFKQMFGYYNGSIITDQGETVKLERVAGFAEDHYAKW